MTLFAAVHSAAGTFHSFGRGLDQHHARRRAALAHVVVRVADAAAAAGARSRPRRACARGSGPGVGYSVGDLRPVALELLGDELREAGQRALPHLGARDADHDGVVRADHDPGVDFRRAVRLRAPLRAAERNVEADGEPAADGGRG